MGPDKLFEAGCVTLSFQVGVRKPSQSLYKMALQGFAELGIAPGEVLHVSSRLQDDLAAAKRVGMKTALYAGDKNSLEATKPELKDPKIKPDRLLTSLEQI